MLHFTETEFADRLRRTRAEMQRRGLDAMLLFAPESQFWLTGYDTFGYCFFQCLVVPMDREPVLLTRSADLRQAQARADAKRGKQQPSPQQSQPSEKMIKADDQWRGDDFVDQSDALARG